VSFVAYDEEWRRCKKCKTRKLIDCRDGESHTHVEYTCDLCNAVEWAPLAPVEVSGRNAYWLLEQGPKGDFDFCWMCAGVIKKCGWVDELDCDQGFET